MQTFAVAQETACKLPSRGVVSVDHAVPFQRSTTSPTAMHVVAEVHETAFSPVSGALLGFAIV